MDIFVINQIFDNNKGLSPIVVSLCDCRFCLGETGHYYLGLTDFDECLCKADGLVYYRIWRPYIYLQYLKDFDQEMEMCMKSIIGNMIAAAGLMVAGSVMAAEELPVLAKKLSCTVCHSINVKVIGPSFKDVATKYKGVTKFTYKGKEYPLIEGLVIKVSEGGSGSWGSMPMPASDPSGAKKADITELIKLVLSLAAK